MDFRGGWDVHWGYDLAFAPWPNIWSLMESPQTRSPKPRASAARDLARDVCRV